MSLKNIRGSFEQQKDNLLSVPEIPGSVEKTWHECVFHFPVKVPAHLKPLLITVNQNLSVLLVKTGFQDREGTKISLKEHINCLNAATDNQF